MKIRSLKKIFEMFDNVYLRDKVVDPASYFEYATWYAFLYLDNAIKIIPNFKMKNNSPLSHASPNKADIEIYYKNFILLIETTLTQGRKQVDNESEPVLRHLWEFKCNIKNKDVYSLFIAKKIDLDIVNFFFHHMKSPLYHGELLYVIPLKLTQFKKILIFSKDIGGLTEIKFYKLLNMLIELSKIYTNGYEWFKKFDNKIEEWKNNLIKN